MAIVTQKNYTSYSELISDMTAMWDWAAIEDKTLGGYATKIFWVDSSKTYGIAVADMAIGIHLHGTTTYDYSEGGYSNLSIRFEKTDTSLIISALSGNTVTAINCSKYIICNGLNSLTKEEYPILIYLRSKSNNNELVFYAPDVDSITAMAAQDGNANTNAKTTNLIPFYSPSSAFITTDVFVSLCENISAWDFSGVVINGYTYRMSGSVFARDI